jgi:hypothetical protein
MDKEWMMRPKMEENAGGMSYRTMKGIDTSLLTTYLEGHDKRSSAAILEKNKKYFIASANKTKARLELANLRIMFIENHYDKDQLTIDKINHGLNWLKILKIKIKNTTKNHELETMIPYKKWHAVKLISSAAEGYAISNSIKRDIMELSNQDLKLRNSQLENAVTHLNHAKKIFINLLNLDENSNFNVAEKSRIKAYEELKIAQSILK